MKCGSYKLEFYWEFSVISNLVVCTYLRGVHEFSLRDYLVSGQILSTTFIGPTGTALAGCHCESWRQSQSTPFTPVPLPPKSTFLPYCCPRPALVTTRFWGLTLGSYQVPSSGHIPWEWQLSMVIPLGPAARGGEKDTHRYSRVPGADGEIGQAAPLWTRNSVFWECCQQRELGRQQAHNSGCPSIGREGGAGQESLFM